MLSLQNCPGELEKQEAGSERDLYPCFKSMHSMLEKCTCPVLCVCVWIKSGELAYCRSMLLGVTRKKVNGVLKIAREGLHYLWILLHLGHKFLQRREVEMLASFDK